MRSIVESTTTPPVGMRRGASQAPPLGITRLTQRSPSREPAPPRGTLADRLDDLRPGTPQLRDPLVDPGDRRLQPPSLVVAARTACIDVRLRITAVRRRTAAAPERANERDRETVSPPHADLTIRARPRDTSDRETPSYRGLRSRTRMSGNAAARPRRAGPTSLCSVQCSVMATRTAVVFGALALVACTPTGQQHPQIIHDESGVAFYLTGFYVYEIPDVTPPAPTCEDGSAGNYVAAYNQFFFVAAGCPGRGFLPENTRCVVCETASDCPEAGRNIFECREGLCQRRRWGTSENHCGNTTPRSSQPIATRLDELVGSR